MYLPRSVGYKFVNTFVTILKCFSYLSSLSGPRKRFIFQTKISGKFNSFSYYLFTKIESKVNY